MERIRDLLDPTRDAVRLREDPERGVWLENAAALYVGSCAEVLALMTRGLANRAVASTAMNADSSRSHAVFAVDLTHKDTVSGSETQGRLVLVDLAGSEMVRKTGATGQVLEEAKTINKSLSALGNVIKALTENGSHVPYRDSKLTRLLSDSLGGSAKTALIVTASPAVVNREETISTLRFGTRAKRVKNAPVVRRERSTRDSLERLQRALAEKEALVRTLQRAL
jgi:kinesin family protein 5